MADDNLVFDVPQECWGGVVKDEGPNFHIEVEKVPVPHIGPRDVLVRLSVTGLCLTDVHFMMNDWDFPTMRELGVKCAGHEGAGVIVKVGPEVTKYRPGQRAAIGPTYSSCGVCELCRSGRIQYCLETVYAGGLRDGSYQQYCSIPENYVILIPEGVSDYVAGPAMCSAVTAYSSIKESGLKPGQWALFSGGGGGVGIQGVQLAAAMGLRPIVVDTGEERRNLALGLGAERFVDFRETDAIGEVLRLTEGGAHGVFVSAVQSYPVSLSYLGTRIGGQLMCIGLPPSGKYRLAIDPTQLCLRNQSIKGTVSGAFTDYAETMDFARRGKLRLEPTIVGLSKWNEAIQRLKQGEVSGRIVVDFDLP